MEPGHDLSLPTLANFRDLGGYRTADGRTTTPGLMFRSRALDVIDDGDLDTLPSLAPVFERFTVVGGGPALLRG